MTLTLPTEKAKPVTDLGKQTILIYAKPKLGKSTFASKAPNAIFFECEPGLNHLEVFKVPTYKWEDFLDACKLVAKGDHPFKTVVIDTVDNAFKACSEFICAKNGVEFETITIDPGSADATSVMLQAASKKPDAILLNLPKGIMVPMLAAAEQQGLNKTVHFISTTPAYNADVPKAIGPVWNNKLDIHLEFQPVESAGADNKNWKSTMDAYGAKTDPRDSFAQSGYLAARIVTDALLKMDPKQITRANVSTALRNVSGFKSDMLCKPFYVGGGARHNANNSGPVVTVSGNGFHLHSADCLTAADPELADIRADEAKLSAK